MLDIRQKQKAFQDIPVGLFTICSWICPNSQNIIVLNIILEYGIDSVLSRSAVIAGGQCDAINKIDLILHSKKNVQYGLIPNIGSFINNYINWLIFQDGF